MPLRTVFRTYSIDLSIDLLIAAIIAIRAVCFARTKLSSVFGHAFQCTGTLAVALVRFELTL